MHINWNRSTGASALAVLAAGTKSVAELCIVSVANGSPLIESIRARRLGPPCEAFVFGSMPNSLLWPLIHDLIWACIFAFLGCWDFLLCTWDCLGCGCILVFLSIGLLRGGTYRCGSRLLGRGLLVQAKPSSGLGFGRRFQLPFLTNLSLLRLGLWAGSLSRGLPRSRRASRTTAPASSTAASTTATAATWPLWLASTLFISRSSIDTLCLL